MEQKAKRQCMQSVHTRCIPIVMTFLNAGDLVRCSEVSKEWNYIVQYERDEWLLITLRQNQHYTIYEGRISDLYEFYKRKWIDLYRYAQLLQSFFDENALCTADLFYYLEPLRWMSSVLEKIKNNRWVADLSRMNRISELGTTRRLQELRLISHENASNFNLDQRKNFPSAEAYADFHLKVIGEKVHVHLLIQRGASCELFLKLYKQEVLILGEISWFEWSANERKSRYSSFNLVEYIEFYFQLSRKINIVVDVHDRWGFKVQLSCYQNKIILVFSKIGLSWNVILWSEIMKALMKFPKFQQYFRNNYSYGLPDEKLKDLVDGVEVNLPFARNEWAKSTQLQDVFAKMRARNLLRK